MACVICVSLWEAIATSCVCDCFYLHGDSVGTAVFVYSLSALPDWIPNQTDPLWLSCPCRSRCRVACCWFRRTFVILNWLFHLSINGSVCQLVSLAVGSHSRAWTQLDVFPSPLFAWAMWGYKHTGLTAWFTHDSPTPLSFFNSIVEWSLGIPHRIETRIDLLHLVSCFRWWQI